MSVSDMGMEALGGDTLSTIPTAVSLLMNNSVSRRRGASIWIAIWVESTTSAPIAYTVTTGEAIWLDGMAPVGLGQAS